RGSHRFDRSLRGTAATARWLDHRELVESHMVSIPARAGDMVVMNNALVHSSFPNHTRSARLAVATGLAPQGAQLVHFRRIDENVVNRYSVDRTFFQNYTPQRLLAAPPGIDVAEEI